MINEILNKIISTEDCRILQNEEIQKIDSVKSYKLVIEVKTQVSLQSGVKDLILYIAIPDPPVTLPKIFINNTSYEELQYVPHINRDLNVCIFDDGINHRFDPTYFPEIVEEMIHSAKQIITQYDDQQLKSTEFKREFKAYWEMSYNKYDFVSESGLAIITDENLPYKGSFFYNPLNGFKYLLYQESYLFEKFKYYLEYRNIQLKEIEVFEVIYNQNQPPFHLTFSESVNYIKEEDQKRFKQSVNKHGIHQVLVFFKNAFGEFYGWVYNNTVPPFEAMLRHQRRQITPWQMISGQEFGKSFVQRLIFSELTPNRLSNRTSGYVTEKKISACVVGLGSVGSNLLNLLIKLPINKFCLVDPDSLKLENIYRYQFGFDFIGMNKAEIAKFNILNKDPFCEVITNGKSIIDVLKTQSSLLEEYELIFIAVGDTMLEKFLLDHLASTKCKRPVIIFWVEAFMASGQMLYIHPEDYSKATILLQEYPFHVLNDNIGFLNVYLKEGSCQTGYFPYSESNLTLFLSSTFPYLFELLRSKEKPKSKVITWIGDKEFIKNRGLVLSDFGEKGNSFQIQINEL